VYFVILRADDRRYRLFEHHLINLNHQLQFTTKTRKALCRSRVPFFIVEKSVVMGYYIRDARFLEVKP
jgi:hypothetical protein